MANKRVKLFFMGLPTEKKMGVGLRVKLYGGRVVRLPPIGEYLFVLEHEAEDLMRKYNFPELEIQPFSRSEKLAKGRQRDLEVLEKVGDGKAIQSSRTVYTEEDLETMLQTLRANKTKEVGNTVEIPSKDDEQPKKSDGLEEGNPMKDAFEELENIEETGTAEGSRRGPGRPKKEVTE